MHYPPKVQLSKLVNSFKGVSARLLRKEFSRRVRRYRWGGHFRSGSGRGADTAVAARDVRPGR
ncbi:transposase [Streptomyces xiangluensis]|uniref:Transposase n=1 Tax=Streptomyces xiangluensis TaxID=2665720 RepID=A0ABV8YRX4_9ACTN